MPGALPERVNLLALVHSMPKTCLCLAQHTQIRGMNVGEYLRHLREKAGLSQTEVASVLGVGQPAVSKLEARTDILLSTFGSYVEAVGGRPTVKASLD